MAYKVSQVKLVRTARKVLLGHKERKVYKGFKVFLVTV
jgi:hypothetical protein